MGDFFHRVAVKVANKVGSSTAFLIAILVIVVWAISGPLFDFSDTWQLVINTGTTIVTFLMVFLIQNTQNRDAKAMQLKLDELIRSSPARDEMVDLEDLSDGELAKLEADFHEFHERHASKATKIVQRRIKEAKQRRSLIERIVK